MYAVVPPVADAVADPFDPLLQLTWLFTTPVATSEAGSVIVTEAESVHPLASVIVTLYVPAITPVIEAVVAAFDHE